MRAQVIMSQSGRLWTFGEGNQGQLGHKAFEDEPLPLELEMFSAMKVRFVVCVLVLRS